MQKCIGCGYKASKKFSRRDYARTKNVHIATFLFSITKFIEGLALKMLQNVLACRVPNLTHVNERKCTIVEFLHTDFLMKKTTLKLVLITQASTTLCSMCTLLKEGVVKAIHAHLYIDAYKHAHACVQTHQRTYAIRLKAYTQEDTNAYVDMTHKTYLRP